MPKIHQVNAIYNGANARCTEAVSSIHHQLQKNDLFNGHARKYSARDDDPTSSKGERLPDENKPVLFRARVLLKDCTDRLADLLNAMATRDWANTEASADVVLDGQVFFKDMPVTFILAMERRFNDIHTLVKKLPTLDAAEQWTLDPAQDLFASKPIESARTKKLSRPLVLAPATTEHPAQVKEVVEDVNVGTWTTTKYSSAFEATEINALIARCEKLQRAFKEARARANDAECEQQNAGRKILDYVLAGTIPSV
jgi:hypothetical protein